MAITNVIRRTLRRRRLNSAVIAILAVGLLAALFAGCAGQSSSSSSADGSEDGAGAGNASQSQPADNVGAGIAASNSDTVSYANPNAAGVSLNDSRDAAPDDATSLDAVIWTTEPVIEAGALSAAGTLAQGARLSEPLNGEPSAFSVYYGDNAEVMVELLPDLGPMHVWDTDATVAPGDFELVGDEFTIRAYSPLFMDVGPSDLKLRVWGYDAGGRGGAAVRAGGGGAVAGGIGAKLGAKRC